MRDLMKRKIDVYTGLETVGTRLVTNAEDGFWDKGALRLEMTVVHKGKKIEVQKGLLGM